MYISPPSTPLLPAGVLTFLPQSIQSVSHLGLTLKPLDPKDPDPDPARPWRYLVKIGLGPHGASGRSEDGVAGHGRDPDPASDTQQTGRCERDPDSIIRKLLAEGKLESADRTVRSSLISATWPELEVSRSECVCVAPVASDLAFVNTSPLPFAHDLDLIMCRRTGYEVTNPGRSFPWVRPPGTSAIISRRASPLKPKRMAKGMMAKVAPGQTGAKAERGRGAARAEGLRGAVRMQEARLLRCPPTPPEDGAAKRSHRPAPRHMAPWTLTSDGICPSRRRVRRMGSSLA